MLPFFDLSKLRAPSASAIKPGESIFQWLDRCSTPICATARDLWNDRLSRLQPAEVAQLSPRLLSADRDNVLGAYFELRLCAAFLDGGLAVHLETAPGCPDIRMSCDDRMLAVEAKVRHESRKLASRDRQLHFLFQAAAGYLRHSSLRLWIDDSDGPTRTPSPRRLARWMDENAHLARSLDAIVPRGESLQYEELQAGLSLGVQLLSIPTRSLPPTTVFAGGMSQGAWSNGAGMLDDLLTSIERQHRDSDTPVLAAVAWNEQLNEPDEDDIEEALEKRRSRPGFNGLIWYGPVAPTRSLPDEPTLWVCDRTLPICSHWPWSVRIAGSHE